MLKKLICTSLLLVVFGVNANSETTLKLDREIETRPFAEYNPLGYTMGDLECLAYVPVDETLWIGDDGRDCVHEMDRITGVRKSVITDANILDNFQGTQDLDANSGGSNVNELETVAYDSVHGALYIINTVNNILLDPPLDIASVFRLYRQENGTYIYDSWKELPSEYKYDAMAIANGKIYISDGSNIHLYDFETNQVTSTPEFTVTMGEDIHGLSYDGTYLWALTYAPDNKLYKIYLDTKVLVKTYDLSDLIGDARGLAVTEDRIYVGEGWVNHPNNELDERNQIFVFYETNSD